LSLLERAIELLQRERVQFDAAFGDNPLLRRVPQGLEAALTKLRQQFDFFSEESDRLAEHVQSIAAVLQEQQRYAQIQSGLLAPADLNQLIHDTLQMEAHLLRRRQIALIESFSPLPQVPIQRTKLSRVLFYLLKNAWEAVEECGGEPPGRIELRTFLDERGALVQVIDNGVGIRREHHGQIFEHGFTTKRHVSGFGLHYCANAMREMMGRIEIHSDGPGQGTTVTLIFPAGRSGSPFSPSKESAVGSQN